MNDSLKQEELVKMLDIMKKLVKKGSEIIKELENLIEIHAPNQFYDYIDLFGTPNTVCSFCTNWNGSICSVIDRGCNFEELK